MRYLLLLLPLVLVGCGYVDRGMAHLTGDGSETCHEGVTYLQFTSGATVMYNPDGSIHTCGEPK